MTPIERAARAVAAYTDQRMPPAGDIITCEGIARVALQALRLDPSGQSVSCSTDMIDAGRNAWMEWNVSPDDFKRANAAAVDSWNAMIDVALAEK